LFTDPDLELSVERIVHGDQRFTFVRPLRPGDIVIATARIDRVRLRAGSELISATVDITGDSELICTAQATFAHAREAAA
jgi:acyl-coenzyme A thioesterase PaaI-like protein